MVDAPVLSVEPEPADFHESNEKQAKEPFGSSDRSRARPKQNKFTKNRTGLENIRVGQMFAKDNSVLKRIHFQNWKLNLKVEGCWFVHHKTTQSLNDRK